MSDYGRFGGYGDRDREHGGGWGVRDGDRNHDRHGGRGGLFSGWRESHRSRDGENQSGGWFGDGRTSDYDPPHGGRSAERGRDDHPFSHDHDDHRGGASRGGFGSGGGGSGGGILNWGGSGGRAPQVEHHQDRGGAGFGGFGGGHREPDRSQGGGFGSQGEGDRSRSRYGSDDSHGGLPMDETSRLIASNKVEGTTVYGRDGERLGTIFNFMVDKFSGKVEYAVMRYGGFLGMGERYYPLPWKTLTYDTRAGGYRIDMRERDLERAPSFDRNSEPDFDRNYGNRVHDYYGLKY